MILQFLRVAVGCACGRVRESPPSSTGGGSTPLASTARSRPVSARRAELLLAVGRATSAMAVTTEQQRIAEWQRGQLDSDAAEKNANFQPVGDWRDRVAKARVKKG